jgi:hypothetical protein
VFGCSFWCMVGITWCWELCLDACLYSHCAKRRYVSRNFGCQRRYSKQLCVQQSEIFNSKTTKIIRSQKQHVVGIRLTPSKWHLAPCCNVNSKAGPLDCHITNSKCIYKCFFFCWFLCSFISLLGTWPAF